MSQSATIACPLCNSAKVQELSSKASKCAVRTGTATLLDLGLLGAVSRRLLIRRRPFGGGRVSVHVWNAKRRFLERVICILRSQRFVEAFGGGSCAVEAFNQ